MGARKEKSDDDEFLKERKKKVAEEVEGKRKNEFFVGLASNRCFALLYLSLRFVLGEQLREPPEVLRVLEQSADLGEGGCTRRRGQLGDADGGRGRRRRRRRWVHGFSFFVGEGSGAKRGAAVFSLFILFSLAPSVTIQKIVHFTAKTRQVEMQGFLLTLRGASCAQACRRPGGSV